MPEPSVDLLAPWAGPHADRLGGWPPFDRVTPATLEEAVHEAVARKRAEVAAIAGNPAAATFENTIEALEDSGRALRQVHALLRVFASSMAVGEWPAVVQRLAPLLPALEDEIAHDPALFGRVEAVWATFASLTSKATADQRRLTQVIRDRFLRQGAALSAVDKERLQAINGELSALSARYNQNLIAEQDRQAVFIDDDAGLAGLPAALCESLAAAAVARGRPGQWAVPCLRPQVWPFLTHSTRRDLREQVWRLWNDRGDCDGEHDNKPLANRILKLRGEKARLLGHASYAHLALADRMARTPEAAMAVLQRTWNDVHATTRRQIADFQAIARAEGHDFELAPWDRLHFAEKFRQARFGFDANAVKPYLELEQMLQAMFWCAGQLHGLSFVELHGMPVVHPSVRVFEVSREVGREASRVDGTQREPVGVLLFDLFHRPGKAHGSYQDELRTAESFRGRVLPISRVVSTFPPPAEGEPVLLPWEYANVFFHEFGHALHMLLNAARYPSLGSMGVAWDFVELPALLNERWLMRPEVLRRFARHHQSGEPMPEALVEQLQHALRYDRIFALNLDFLAPAIVDLRLHLLADGTPASEIDAVEVERQTLAELGMPDAWDQIMRVTHNFHCFIGAYAAGLYSYLWADVMAADAAEAFAESPGGYFDAGTAGRWRDSVLGAGSTVPADQAWQRFRGREPDPGALMRRFGLAPSG